MLGCQWAGGGLAEPQEQQLPVLQPRACGAGVLAAVGSALQRWALPEGLWGPHRLLSMGLFCSRFRN